MHKTDRRQFLSRSAVLTAMHAPLLLGAAPAHAAPSDTAPVRFKRLSLLTKPLESMKAFYGKTMGFQLEEEADDSFTVVAGDSKIDFRRAEDHANPFYHFAFSISENKIEAAKTWTEARTIVLTQSSTGRQIIHFRNWNAHAMYFLDPGGNIGEFIAHHSLDTSSEGEFSLEDLLYTSEIGLVVDDVHEAAKEIEPLVGIKNARRGSRNFAAVGDARGYFIIVPNQRVWLPTDDVKAEPYIVHAQFQSHASGTTDLVSGPFTLERINA
jgi:catechol-2,3-dioxygenase